MINLYFITISEKRRKGNPKVLYEHDKYDIRRYLNRCSSHYCLYPEFDITSRLHYHGFIKINDMIKWHKQKHIVDSVLGYTKIVKIKNRTEMLRAILYR